jgi:hypothetical protein
MYFELYLLDKSLSRYCRSVCGRVRTSTTQIVFKIAGHFPGCPAPFHPEINFLLFILKFPYQTIGPQLTGI